ncbi:MAG: TorF family putative porin [Azoarcus sp.]|jgi:uncharacterized protein (TIGR02001 family)|nr:TorF family putative porin [Azoarcus sp.]
MRLSIAAALLVPGLSCIPAAYADETSPPESPFSANISIASDYAYRGISQTDERPALQGGLDFKHASGLYIGTWGSNVSWLRDAEKGTDASSGNSVELDVYLGFSKEFGDFGMDVGVLEYTYPGKYSRHWKNETGMKNPYTTEGYLGVSWKFLSFKYSHSFTTLFGAPNSKGSDYFDLSASYEVVKNLKLNAHVGHQRIFGPAKSYSDWKLGATYTLGGFDIGLHYVDTNLSHKKSANADARAILSIGKSF